MIARPLVAVCMLALSACGASEEKSAPAAASVGEQAAPTRGEREHVDLNAAHPELAPEQKIGGAEGRSPFEGDRVVGLNAIVRRSLDVSKEFDAAAEVRAAATSGDRTAAEKALATVAALHARAKSALDDMLKAEAELKESGEYYDAVIFAGMMKFVADIEAETREEMGSLGARLGP